MNKKLETKIIEEVIHFVIEKLNSGVLIYDDNNSKLHKLVLLLLKDHKYIDSYNFTQKIRNKLFEKGIGYIELKHHPGILFLGYNL